MLPKDTRIPRSLFKSILESRKFLNSPYFSMRIGDSADVRSAVAVSKKVSKSAVVRNRTRRRVYAALRPMLPSLPKGLYLLVAKPGAEKLQGEKLSEELAQLFKKG